jgi:ribonuclease D
VNDGIGDRNKGDHFLESALRYQRENAPIRLYGDQLWFQGASLNIGSRRQVLKLIKILINAENHSMSLRQIVAKLTGIPDIDCYPPPVRRTYRNKIQKLLQRARSYLNNEFLKVGVKYHWLAYNSQQCTWDLYTLPTSEHGHFSHDENQNKP